MYTPAIGYAQKLRLFELQEGRCASCDLHTTFMAMTRHHIIPRMAGGPNVDANIVLLCPECHKNCHSSDRDARHGALRPILIAKDCTAEERAKVYRIYRQYGVRADNQRHMRNQKMPVSRLEYQRFEDDGGGAFRWP